MTKKIQFFDGFDTWRGVNPNYLEEATAYDCPWHLEVEGDANYADLVDPTAGQYGGGALKLSRQEARSHLSIRTQDNLLRTGFNTAQYCVTFGYKLILGDVADTRPDFGQVLMSIAARSAGDDSFVQIVKRPDDKACVVWCSEYGYLAGDSTDTWGTARYVTTLPYRQMILLGGEFVAHELSSPGLLKLDYETMDVTSSVGLGAILNDIYGLARNLDGTEVYVLDEVNKIHVLDNTLTYTGVTHDMSGSFTALTAMTYDTVNGGLYVAEGTTVYRLDAAFNVTADTINLSSKLSSIWCLAEAPSCDVTSSGINKGGSAGDVRSLLFKGRCSQPSLQGGGLSNYLVAVGDDTTVVAGKAWNFRGVTIGAGAVNASFGESYGVLETAGGDYNGIFFDGIFQYDLYRDEADSGTSAGRMARFYLHGYLLENNYVVKTALGLDPVGYLDWNTTHRLEHCFSPLGRDEAIADAGNAVATKYLNGTQHPDLLPANDVGATSYASVGLNSIYTVELTTGRDVFTGVADSTYNAIPAWVDDFYLISDDTPTGTPVIEAGYGIDPNQYIGDFRIHTLRPNAIAQGNLYGVEDDGLEAGEASLTETLKLPIYSNQYAINTNTQYVVGAEAGDFDRLAKETAVITGTIEAVQVGTYWRRDDVTLAFSNYPEDGSGTQTHDRSLHVGLARGNNYQYTANMEFHPSGIWQDVLGVGNLTGNPYQLTSHMSVRIFESDPFTASAWTTENLNNTDVVLLVDDGYPYGYPGTPN